MKNYTKAFTTMVVFLFFSFAFVQEKINPFEWEQDTRLAFIVTVVMAAIASAPLIEIKN